jgi:2-hydroxychromene-2-carboxylate isomerase
METIRFYFSFRSPYAWFAFHRIEAALSGLPVTVEYVPCFPPEDYQGDPRANPAKTAYIDADVARIAEAYGLGLRWPKPFDADWIRPHAAYLFTEDQRRGRAFGLAAYGLRFSEGRDIGADDVMAEAARRTGVDPEAAVRAADDAALHGRVMHGMGGGREDGLFGVPFFVYRGQTFWGNDRIEWLVRAIKQDIGKPVPNLRSDSLAPPCGWEGARPEKAAS